MNSLVEILAAPAAGAGFVIKPASCSLDKIEPVNIEKFFALLSILEMDVLKLAFH